MIEIEPTTKSGGTESSDTPRVIIPAGTNTRDMTEEQIAALQHWIAEGETPQRGWPDEED